MSDAEISDENCKQTASEINQDSLPNLVENIVDEEKVVKVEDEDEDDDDEGLHLSYEDLWADESIENWLKDHNDGNKKNKLPSMEVKRRNTIYDLYKTEKNYCRTLTVLKRTHLDDVIFNQILTLDQLLCLIPDVHSLDNLIRIHSRFLQSINHRRINRIEEAFLKFFVGRTAKSLIDAYVKFSLRKEECKKFYDHLMKENSNFKSYITQIYSKDFLKESKSTFDGLLLLIAQRLSKYHQLIESIVKYTPSDYDSMPRLLEAEKAVKNLIRATDAGVGEMQMRSLRREIVQNFDHKSYAGYGFGCKFTINDLNSEIRTLTHAVDVQWLNAKGSSANVKLLIFNDVLVFIQKSTSGVYSFFSQDKKCSIISLKKMHVTDKAGKQTGVYLIAYHPKPEMYEVKCKTNKENLKLIDKITRAITQFAESIAESSVLQTVSSDTIVSSSTVENISDSDLEALDLLFEKFKPINDKLAEYYNELFDFYTEMGSYAQTFAAKVQNDDDRNQILDIVNKGFNAQALALKNIEISKAWNELMKQSFKFLSVAGGDNFDDKSTESCVKFDTDDVSKEDQTALDDDDANFVENEFQNERNIDDRTLIGEEDVISVEDEEKSEEEDQEVENDEKDPIVEETTSAFDSQIGRSNTFHYVRNCDKRRGIKKHPTVSGVPGADVKVLVPKIKVARSYNDQISMSGIAPPSSPELCTLEALFKQISESQVTLQKLNQENLHLKLELAAYKERSRDKNFPLDNNNNFSHVRYSLPADNYSTLEEMRRLSTTLDDKRRGYTQMVDDKQFDVEKREKILADREMQMERQVNELRGRWAHLHQLWEHQRMSGLPLAPMPPYLSFDMPVPMPLPSIHGQDVRMPFFAPPPSQSDNSSSYISAASPGSSNDMKTVMEPSVMTNCSSNAAPPTLAEGGSAPGEFLAPLPFFGPPAPGVYYGAGVFRSPSLNEVPPALQGSLVHNKNYLSNNNRKGVIPAKLSAKNLTPPSESLSSKIFSSSSKKSSPTGSTLKNRSRHSSSLEKVVDESSTTPGNKISAKKK